MTGNLQKETNQAKLSSLLHQILGKPSFRLAITVCPSRRHVSLGLSLMSAPPRRRATVELRLLPASQHRHAIDSCLRVAVYVRCARVLCRSRIGQPRKASPVFLWLSHVGCIGTGVATTLDRQSRGRPARCGGLQCRRRCPLRPRPRPRVQVHVQDPVRDNVQHDQVESAGWWSPRSRSPSDKRRNGPRSQLRYWVTSGTLTQSAPVPALKVGTSPQILAGKSGPSPLLEASENMSEFSQKKLATVEENSQDLMTKATTDRRYSRC